jgi:hypothetical protein
LLKCLLLRAAWLHPTVSCNRRWPCVNCQSFTDFARSTCRSYPRCNCGPSKFRFCCKYLSPKAHIALLKILKSIFSCYSCAYFFTMLFAGWRAAASRSSYWTCWHCRTTRQRSPRRRELYRQGKFGSLSEPSLLGNACF